MNNVFTFTLIEFLFRNLPILWLNSNCLVRCKKITRSVERVLVANTPTSLLKQHHEQARIKRKLHFMLIYPPECGKPSHCVGTKSHFGSKKFVTFQMRRPRIKRSSPDVDHKSNNICVFICVITDLIAWIAKEAAARETPKLVNINTLWMLERCRLLNSWEPCFMVADLPNFAQVEEARGCLLPSRIYMFREGRFNYSGQKMTPPKRY